MKIDKKNPQFPFAMIPQNDCDTALLDHIANEEETLFAVRVGGAESMPEECAVSVMRDPTITDLFGSTLPIFLYWFTNRETGEEKKVYTYPKMMNRTPFFHKIDDWRIREAQGQRIFPS